MFLYFASIENIDLIFVCVTRIIKFSRRSRHPPRRDQFVYPHYYVHVLPCLRSRTSIPEVPLVEEASYYHATGKLNIFSIFCINFHNLTTFPIPKYGLIIYRDPLRPTCVWVINTHFCLIYFKVYYLNYIKKCFIILEQKSDINGNVLFYLSTWNTNEFFCFFCVLGNTEKVLYIDMRIRLSPNCIKYRFSYKC